MNVDEAWRRLGAGGEFPREALQWSLDHWDAAAPRFIAKLRAHASGAGLSDADVDALFYAIHLSAEKGEERAFAPLCDILAGKPDVELWLGDVLTETLPGLLINLYDGDVDRLKRLYETSGADEAARAAALQALAYLVRARGVMSDDEMRAYLSERGEALSGGDPELVANAWVTAAGALGYDSLAADAARLFSRGAVSPALADIKTFHADLALSRATPDGLQAFREASVEPFGSTIETLGRWSQASPVWDEGDVAPGEADTPYVNPYRDVGRNDPCPCGSGKKYKKCCLAVEKGLSALSKREGRFF